MSVPPLTAEALSRLTREEGSSVFPTGGYANPVLTALALTLRLADHVKARIRRDAAA